METAIYVLCTWLCTLLHCTALFTKPPLLQESRLTGGGSPNLVVLVEWKVPVERFMGAANCFHWFYPWLYTCAVQTADWNWFWLLYLRLYSVKGFPLYEDTDSRRATTHQLYCFAIEVGFGANELTQVFGHGWLCHPTSSRGQFSENFNLSTGFVIQEVKVQTLIHFYDSLNQ